jgi:hypothetical protein
MATLNADERNVSVDLLKKLGTKWAVLTALVVDLSRRGVRILPELSEELKLARMKVISGCFSPCEVGCALGKIEGQLISVGAALGEDYLRPWFDLIGQAMEGRIEPSRIAEIPALQPVANDCTFLECSCGGPAGLQDVLRPEATGGCR